MERKDGRKPEAARKTRMTYEQLLEGEIGVVADVVGFANSQMTSIYADTTVVKSPEVVYRGVLSSRNRFISEEYLLNFRRSRADMSQIIGVNNYRLPSVVQSQACRRHKEDPAKLVPLPKFGPMNEPIGPVIRSRRSFRDYSGRPIPLEQLATILYHAQGITGKMELRGIPKTVTFDDDDALYVRAAPSGGGLYPISLYVFAMGVKDLERGAYRYVPEHHALKRVARLDADFDVNRLGQFGEMNAQAANAFVVFVYDLYANSRKYGDSGMAYAFIEAGEISGHVHLACTALGLGACDIGGFSKSEIEALLGLDGLSRHAIHFLIIGNR
ncbi:MAG: SagB/ThcOx family dehydrogenase [Spirochaetales bacterium]|nr:SagB/ThcOx family dehydrogenase [Spirochaetales bacterium]